MMTPKEKTILAFLKSYEYHRTLRMTREESFAKAEEFILGTTLPKKASRAAVAELRPAISMMI